MNSNENHSQQGETKQSTSGTPTSPQLSVAKVSSRFPTTRLGFNTAPAVIPSQQSERSTITNSIGLRSASVQLEWRWLHTLNQESTTSSSSTTIRCVQPLNNNRVLLVDSTKLPSLFVQPELIPKENRDQTICSNVRGDLKNHWLMIYACLDLSYADRLALRCMCRVFNEVEKILTLDEHRYKMLKPMPLFAIFPHPNYSTLNDLMNKLIN